MTDVVVWAALTLAAAGFLIYLAYASYELWREEDGRCDSCGRPFSTGYYEDSETGGQFCSLICAYQESEGMIEWVVIGEAPEWRETAQH